VSDLNGDGKPDIAVANANSLNVGVLLGNGDGTFQPAVAYASGGIDDTNSIAVADVNGDGKPDLLTANVNGSSPNGSVGVLLGNGDGTFQTAVTYPSGSNAALAVAVADLNGDGKPDLVVANCSDRCNGHNGVLGVLLGNGDGTFQTCASHTITDPSIVVPAADVKLLMGSLANGHLVTVSPSPTTKSPKSTTGTAVSLIPKFWQTIRVYGCGSRMTVTKPEIS
jgi:hypothetical protein